MDLLPDSNMLRVELHPAGFVADDAVSTCPLLTPSPPTNALVDPTSDSQEPSYIIVGDILVTKLKEVEGRLILSNIIYLNTNSFVY